jgi:Flp pilus assembly pilin Flp
MHRLTPPRISLSDERAQTLAEYSLLVALIAIVVAVTLPTLGSQVASMFSRFAAAF